MKVISAYWRKKGLRIDLEGTETEFEKLLAQTSERNVEREYDDYTIYDIGQDHLNPCRVHLSITIPKQGKRKHE